MIRSFEMIDAFLAFALERARELAMDVEPCALSELAPDWLVDPADRGVYRPDGNFFTVSGVRVAKAANREKTAWKQPLIFRKGGGSVLLVCARERGRFLVRLKAAPGHAAIVFDFRNTRVLVCATVECSSSNEQLHCVPLGDLVKDPRIRWSIGHGDGALTFEKVNRLGLLDLPPGEEVDRLQSLSYKAAEDFAWINREVFRYVLAEGHCNLHLREAASLLI